MVSKVVSIFIPFVDLGISSPGSSGDADIVILSSNPHTKHTRDPHSSQEDVSRKLKLKFQHLTPKDTQNISEALPKSKGETSYKAYSVVIPTDKLKPSNLNPPLSPADSTSSQDSDLYDPKLDVPSSSQTDSVKDTKQKPPTPVQGADKNTNPHLSKMDKNADSTVDGKVGEKKVTDPGREGGFSQFEDISDDENSKDGRKEEPMDVDSTTGVSSSSAVSSHSGISPTPSRNIQQQSYMSGSHIPGGPETTSTSHTGHSSTSSTAPRRPIYAAHSQTRLSGDATSNPQHGSVTHSSLTSLSSSTSTTSSKCAAPHPGSSDTHKQHVPSYTSSTSSSQHATSASLSDKEKLRLDKQRESQLIYQFDDDEFSDKEESKSSLRPEKHIPKATSDVNARDSKLSPKPEKEYKSPKTSADRLSPKYGDSKLQGQKLEKEQRVIGKAERDTSKISPKLEGKLSPRPDREQRHSPKPDTGKLLSNRPDSTSPDNSNSSGVPTKSEKDRVLDAENGRSGSPKVPPLKIIIPPKTTAPAASTGESLKSLLMKPALPYVLNPTQDGAGTGDVCSTSATSSNTITTSSVPGSIISSQTFSLQGSVKPDASAGVESQQSDVRSLGANIPTDVSNLVQQRKMDDDREVPMDVSSANQEGSTLLPSERSEEFQEHSIGSSSSVSGADGSCSSTSFVGVPGLGSMAPGSQVLPHDSIAKRTRNKEKETDKTKDGERDLKEEGADGKRDEEGTGERRVTRSTFRSQQQKDQPSKKFK